MTQVTEILSQAANGDAQAASKLLPLVYDELRKLASHRLANETGAQSVNATALVHEAYLRLVGHSDREQWQNRGHFFAAAAEAMRRILVDAARARQSVKRGGDHERVNLDLAQIPIEQPPAEVIAVSEALERLEGVNQPAAELVKLRYFGGHSIREAAEILGVAPRTADGLWAYAKAWLAIEIAPQG